MDKQLKKIIVGEAKLWKLDGYGEHDIDDLYSAIHDFGCQTEVGQKYWDENPGDRLIFTVCICEAIGECESD